MVALFVVLTITAFLAVDLVVQKIQQSQSQKKETPISEMSYRDIQDFVGVTLADGGEEIEEEK